MKALCKSSFAAEFLARIRAAVVDEQVVVEKETASIVGSQNQAVETVCLYLQEALEPDLKVFLPFPGEFACFQLAGDAVCGGLEIVKIGKTAEFSINIEFPLPDYSFDLHARWDRGHFGSAGGTWRQIGLRQGRWPPFPQRV